MGKIKTFLTSEKAGKYLFIIALAGIILVFISTFDFGNKKEVDSDVSANYAEVTESKLESLVCRITGEKKAEVFVSLDNSEQTVYADSVKESTDLSEDNDGSEVVKKEQKDNKEQNYIIVEDSDGKQQALVVTTLSPTVKGVVVVSNYADDPVIKEQIISAVTTALNISSKKVCVVGVYNR